MEGNYQWFVSPSTASIAPYRYMCDVTFYQEGTYMVACRSSSPCVSPGSYNAMKTVTVTNSGYYVSTPNDSKIVTVSYSPPENQLQSQSTLSKQTMVNYSLSNLATSLLAASGKMPLTGGALDFSHVPSGIYILQIDNESGTLETFKIVLK